MRSSTAMASPRWRPSARTAWLLLFVAALAWSLVQMGLFGGDPLMNPAGWQQLWRFVSAAWQPDLSPDFLRLTLNSAVITLAYGVVGTTLSLLIGSLLGIVMSETWWQAVVGRGRPYRLPWTLVRGVAAVPRGIHELLWGLLFVNIFGLNPISAVLAITVPFSVIVGKVYADMLDEAPREPFDALIGSGASPTVALVYGLLPTVLLDWVGYGFYRFECAIRAAAVLGVIGAGGLGYQILLSVQSLQYNELWTLFYALMLLSGLADWWSGRVRKQLAAGASGRDLRGSFWLAALLIPLAFWLVGADWSLLWSPTSAENLSHLLTTMWPPRVTSAELWQLLQLAALTLAMSIVAATLAFGMGAVGSFPAARNMLLPGGIVAHRQVGRWWRWGSSAVLLATRFVLLLLRAIPAPIWALILLFIFLPGILPGALALALYNGGILGRLMADVVENVDERPSRALKAQGASGLAAFLVGVVPLVGNRYLAYGLYRWEIGMRETVIVGLVGAGGLGRVLTQQLAAFDYQRLIVTLSIYVGLTFFVDLVSSAVRRAFR